MPLHRRREVLCSISGIGAAAVLGVPVENERTGPEPRWQTTLENTEITDVSRGGSEPVVIVLGESADETDTESQAVAIDGAGTEQWRWPTGSRESTQIEDLRAVASAGDGGWFFAGTTANGTTAVVKLSADRSLVWESTHEMDPTHGVHLVRATGSRLLLIHHDHLPSRYSTTVTGVDSADGSALWKREPLASDYRIERATEYRNGCVLGGAVSGSGGWIARLAQDGRTVWKREYGERKLALVSDIVVDADERLVAVGPQTNAAEQNVRLIALDADGDQVWEQPTVVEKRQLADIVERVRFASYRGEGYTITSSYQSGSDIVVSKAANDGQIYWNGFVDTFDSNPDLHALRSLEGSHVLVGEVGVDSTDGPRAWALGLQRPLTTETPARSMESTERTAETATPTTSVNEGQSTTTRPRRTRRRLNVYGTE